MIRKANKDDLKSIIKLNNKLFKLESGNFDDDTLISEWALSEEREQYFLELVKDGFVYVYEENEKVFGYLAGSIEKVSYEKDKYAEINNMFVDESLRGQGIGTNLLKHS